MFVYFSGHGLIDQGTTRAVLNDCTNYPFEIKLRDFRHEHCINSFVFGVFDGCRTIQSNNPADLVKGGRSEVKRIYEENESNLILIFSSEPTLPTAVKDKTSAALFEYLRNKNEKYGNLVFPEAITHFNHKGKVMNEIACAASIRLKPAEN